MEVAVGVGAPDRSRKSDEKVAVAAASPSGNRPVINPWAIEELTAGRFGPLRGGSAGSAEVRRNRFNSSST